MPHNYQDWYEALEPAILIKVEDFHLLGYREVKKSDIWEFLTASVWPNKSTPALHERMNDVMQMKIGQLIQFIMRTSETTGQQVGEPLDQELVDAVIHSKDPERETFAADISDEEGTSQT